MLSDGYKDEFWKDKKARRHLQKTFSDKFPQNTFLDLILASLAFLKYPLSKKALQGTHVFEFYML